MADNHTRTPYVQGKLLARLLAGQGVPVSFDALLHAAYGEGPWGGKDTARGTLTKRWVLEMALRQAHHGDSTRWNKKFNATATAQQLADINSRAKDDIWECMVLNKMCPEDISKLYGKLSAGIHDSGLDVDSLVVQGNSSPVEHGFLICVANKRFDLSLSA